MQAWRSTRSISLQVSPNTHFPSKFVISTIILSMESGKRSWKLELMSSTRDVAYRVGPGIIFMMFSTLALCPLSWGNEDQNKCPLLDWNVSSGACSSGQSPQSLDQNLCCLASISGSISVPSSSCPKTWTRTSSTENGLVSRLLIVLRVKGVQGKNRAIYIYGVCVRMIH